MKIYILTILGLAITLWGNSQEYNPFAKHGYQPQIASFSGGKYTEVFDQDSIVQIGSVLLNTNTKEIIGFVEVDTLYSEATLEPELVSRWLSPDPLAHKYPELSPYNFVENKPIYMNDPTGESGEVTIDKNTKTLTITSNISFYGNSANTELAIQSAKDIESAWNKANGKVMINGIEYKVRFSVNGTYKPDITKGDIASNTDIKNNYIRVEGSGANVSYMSQGGNDGFFLVKNIAKDGSTTEPHEYGHGLGLWPGTTDGHPPNSDLRGQGTPPGIMYARGTLVDAKYTYDPKKGDSKIVKGMRQNTMNPDSREVNQTDIDKLNLDKLKFVNGKANLGRTTNRYIPNNTGKSDTSPVGPRMEDGSF